MTTEIESYSIKHNRYKKTNDSVCIFVSFSYGNVLQEYVYYYLNELKKVGFDIVFVSSSVLDEDSIKKLKEYASLVIEKSNKGYDFASLLVGLSQINYGRDYKNLLCANDSVFGPFYDLKPILNSVERSEYDMFGMTDSYEIDYHLQSYFLYFKSSVLTSNAWLEFWNGFKVMSDKKQIIKDYEVGLSQHMLKNGFKLGAYCSFNAISQDLNISQTLNSSIVFYKELITNYKFPFLKREVLIGEGISKVYAHVGIIIDIYKWKNAIVDHTKYPIELIENYITYYFNFLVKSNPSFTANKLKNKYKVIFISHTASLSGAPIVFLDFIRWFKHNTDIEFEIIIKETLFNGDYLLKEFQDLGPTIVFDEAGADELDTLRFRLLKENIGLIFSNTLVNSQVEQFLSVLNCPQICYVHELNYVINHLTAISTNLKWQNRRNTYFIACSEVVKDNLVRNHGIPEEKVPVVEAYISRPNENEVKPSQLNELKEKFKIPKNGFVIGGVGTIEWRKGSDLFIGLAKIVCRQLPNAYFIWLGADKEVQADTYKHLMYDVEKSGLSGRVFFAEQDIESAKYYALFDMIAMVSREDPFPLVNLHAAAFAKPIVCFEDVGGSAAFVGKEECGYTVPYLNLDQMAEKIINLQKDPALRAALGKNGQNKVLANNITEVQAPKLFRIMEAAVNSVSPAAIKRPKINILTHIYYDHSYELLRNYLLNLKDFDVNYLFSISIDSLNKKETIKNIRKDFVKAYILETPNIGKDIGGKFALLDLMYKLNLESDYLVFVHDKMSPQTIIGDSWRSNLLKILLPENISNILSMLNTDLSIGMVGAKEHFFSEYDPETDRFRHNNDLIKEYLKYYNFKISNFTYISGTMYWIRSSVFEDFFKKMDLIELRTQLEQGNVLDNSEGTRAHTWERMFCWIATNQGYSITGI
jgi:lipopolysaccharide biosynthesis protein